MPIYEFGYRRWEGGLAPRWLRWWPITRVGVVQALRSRFLRRLLFLAWAPLLYFGPVFYFVGSVTETSTLESDQVYRNVVNMIGPDIGDRLRSNPEAARPAAWSLFFYWYWTWGQSFGLLLVVAIVGPPLISQDVRGKSFLLYFSKPITTWDYLLGKAAVLFAYIAFVTTLPALALYVVSIGFAPSFAAFMQTNLILLRILAAGACLSVPATLLVLYFSSLSRDPRFAAFAWIAVCLLGEVFFQILQTTRLRDAWWPFLLSLREMSLVVNWAIFDVSGQFQSLGIEPLGMFHTAGQSVTDALVVLGVVSALSLVGLVRRITAPLRI